MLCNIYPIPAAMSVAEWIWSAEPIKESPSYQKNMSKDAEAKQRREGIKLILEVGSNLRLKPNTTLGTAGVYFQRFYMFHTFDEYPRELTALGCLFLAGKVEETPKKCRDIVDVALKKFPALYGPRSKTLVAETMGIERVLLQTLKFDLQVDLPYKYLVEYSNKLKEKVDKEEVRTVVQNAWTFVNDSISTTLCLSWEPQVVAIAMLYLSVKFKLSSSTRTDLGIWWEELVANLSLELIDCLCHKVLDFYAVSKVEVMDFMQHMEPNES